MNLESGSLSKFRIKEIKSPLFKSIDKVVNSLECIEYYISDLGIDAEGIRSKRQYNLRIPTLEINQDNYLDIISKTNLIPLYDSWDIGKQSGEYFKAITENDKLIFESLVCRKDLTDNSCYLSSIVPTKNEEYFEYDLARIVTTDHNIIPVSKNRLIK